MSKLSGAKSGRAGGVRPKPVRLSRSGPKVRSGRRPAGASQARKLAGYYGIGEKELSGYVEQARAAGEATAEELVQLLESRLDSVVRRLGWAGEIGHCTELVADGRIAVNGRIIDLPQFLLKPGDHLSLVSGKGQRVASSAGSSRQRGFITADWLNVDSDGLSATLVRLPGTQEVMMPFDVDYPRVIEYLSRA